MGRVEVIKADIAELRGEKVAALRRVEAALQDEIRGLNLQYQARAAATQAKQSVENLDASINEQLEALGELLPRPREATDG
jgi:hypothetical protein